MEVHIGPGQAPRLVEEDDLGRFRVVAAADAASLPRLASELEGVLEFSGPDAAWVSVGWILAATGHAASDEWRAGFEAMKAFATKHGWTRDEPPALRGHVVWRDEAAASASPGGAG